MRKKTGMLRSFTYVILAATCAIITAGCTGYRLGSSLPPGIRVIYVPTFVNKTSEPLLDVATTAACISEIQRDGTLRVGDEQKSDVILYVTLIDLQLHPLRYKNSNNTTTKEYRLSITASLQLKQRSTGRIMVSNVVAGERDFVPTGDLSNAKREALPKAAQDLAHQIVEKVVEYW